MTLQETFCVECGAEDVPLKDGVCRSCRLGDRELLVATREEVHVEVCQKCGAEHRGDSWRTRDDPTEALDRAAMGAVQVHEAVDDPRFELVFEQIDPRVLLYTVTMVGMLWDEPVQEAIEVRVVTKPGICRTCSQQAGGYFEAVLQLRPPKDRDAHEDLEEARVAALDQLDAMQEAGNRRAFVAKIEEVHGGYDLYIGDQQAGRQVAKRLSERFGARVGHSTERVGLQDGQPVTRSSISVRMPPYALGDFVLRDDELWQVRGFTKRLVRIVRLPDGRVDHVDAYDDALTRALPASAVEEATVVSRSGEEAQVLDPETMETVTIQTPGRIVADTVPVVKWDRRVYAVPAVREDDASR